MQAAKGTQHVAPVYGVDGQSPDACRLPLTRPLPSDDALDICLPDPERLPCPKLEYVRLLHLSSLSAVS